jgi:tetratricopeptide (TPR) repeat protein
METLPLHGVAVYNPRLWSDQELKDYFVVRQEVLENLLTALRQETRPHRILVGQRGMGKSTLLRRLALAVEEDEELRLRWLPLTFPEEQYNVSSLADLWRNCLDSLCDRWENQGKSGKANTLENKIDTLADEDTLSSLLAEADKTGQGFLLLIDNLDLILDRLKEEQADLLRILEEEPRLLLLAASVRKLEGPFAKIPSDRLDKISFEEMQNMLRKIAELGGKKEHIQNLLEHNRPRIRTLYELTGGNPRTIVLLYTVLAPDGDVRSDLEGLLDLVTPLYKARFEELSPQGQQVMDALAMHWHPMTARQAADSLDWDINLTSSQLHRLVQQGLVDKVPPVDKRTTFQIDERFFNIWYLMRASRRVRRKFMHLVYFLKLLYTDEEMEAQGRRLLQTARRDPRWAESCLIYGQALEAKSSFRKTLCYTSLSADAKLATDWDLQGEDAKLQSYIATRNQDPIWVQYNTLLQQALSEGRMTAHNDTEGAAQAALHYHKAGLAVLAWENYFFEHKEPPQEDLHKAEEAYRKALEEEPSWAWAWFFLGNVLDHQKRLEEAEQAYRNALAIEPQEAGAWLGLGNVLLQQKRLEEAEQAYRKALELDAENLGYVYNLAHFLVLSKQWRRAEQYIFTLLDKGDEEFFTAYWKDILDLFKEAVQLGKAEQALTLLEESPCGERWLPLREALAAVAANKPSYLNGVAPEVRDPAKKLLQTIAPEFAGIMPINMAV